MMVTLLKNSLQDLRLTYRKLMLVEFMYLFLTSLLFIPLITFIFNRVLRAMNTDFLLNSDVYKIALSYKGLMGLALIAFVFVFLLFIELGILLIIAQKKCFGRDVLIADAFITTLHNIPKLWGIGLLQIALLFIFLIPIVDSPLSAVLSDSINMPIVVRNHIYNSNLYLAVYLLILLAVLYLILRWIFVMHFIFIEGKTTTEAIKSSMELTRSKKIKILVYLLLFNLVIFTAGFVIFLSFNWVLKLTNMPFIKYELHHFTMTISSLFVYAITLLLLPVNMIFLTRLYYRLQYDHYNKQLDHLKVYPNKLLHAFERKARRYFRHRIKQLILIIAIGLLSVFTLNYTFSDQLIDLKWNVAIAGHRGDIHGAPENSISSIKSAISKNVDAVEVDVQMTKDGILVLNHDYSLKRVAGIEASIHDLNYDELAKLDIGSEFSEAFQGERIPTLKEALLEVKGKAIFIIEIKPTVNKLEIAQKVVELIESQDMVSESYIQSFDNSVLQEVRKQNPSIKIGQIFYLAAGNLSLLDVDFYTVEQSVLSDRFLRHAHRKGREVWVWTVNSERNIKKVLEYNIDGIITDYPERVQSIIGLP
jgi:glycerophosphoryl diester phosphodiesterase